MKAKRMTRIIVAAVLLAAVAARPAPVSGADRPDKAFQEAKLLIFDKQWEPALAALRQLISDYPGSPEARQAGFYVGECLSNMPNREIEALAAYKKFLGDPADSSSLVESAEASVIDLSFKLYEKGEKDEAEGIVSRLSSPDKAIRYYAAYKLSQVSDKRLAARSVPVLQRIVATEKDPELLDRARIALLRVSPDSLKVGGEGARPASDSGRILSLKIWEKGGKNPTVSVNIPWALADLAIRAMSEENKQAIRNKGYDLDRIMEQLANTKDNIIRIEGDDSIIILKIENN